MSDNGMVWEEPSKYQGNWSPHEEIAAQLRANPGRWAKIMTGPAPTASHIKRGKVAAYKPAGSFEAVSRNSRMVEGRKVPVADIYARYVGDGS